MHFFLINYNKKIQKYIKNLWKSIFSKISKITIFFAKKFKNVEKIFFLIEKKSDFFTKALKSSQILRKKSGKISKNI